MIDSQPGQQDHKLHYAQILWKRKAIILVCFLVLTGVVLVGTLRQTPIYESTATLLIEMEGPEVLSIRQVVKLGEQNFYSYKDYYQTQYKIMHSRAVAKEALDQLSPTAQARFASADDPVQALLGVVDVDPVKGTRLVKLIAVDKDPAVAAEIANAFAKTYTGSNLNLRAAASQDAIQWLAKRLDTQKARLEESEATLQAYREAHSMIVEPSMQAEDHRVLQQIETIYAEKDAELANLRKLYGPKHPKIITAVAELQALKQKMEGKTQEALNLNREAIEYSVLNRDVETNQRLFDALLTRLKETNLSGGLKANNVAILDQAEPALKPARPILALNLALGAVAGLVLGVGLALVVDLLDNTVKSGEEVQQLTQAPILGTIPYIKAPNKHDRDIITLSDPSGSFAERYRGLRTNLLFTGEPGAPRSVLVTSSNPAEGKTITAANLAITVAQAGSRVALVDADLRRPSLHRVFDLDNSSGLSNYLIGEAELEDVVMASSEPNLHVVPCGVIPPNPSELLGSPRMDQLIRLLKQHFYMVIVDSAPVLAVTDASVLCRAVDQVVQVVLCGTTTRDALRLGSEHLAKVDARVVGTVLNRIDRRTGGGRYRYYYYHHYYGQRKGRSHSSRRSTAVQPRQLEPVASPSA